MGGTNYIITTIKALSLNHQLVAQTSTVFFCYQTCCHSFLSHANNPTEWGVAICQKNRALDTAEFIVGVTL